MIKVTVEQWLQNPSTGRMERTSGSAEDGQAVTVEDTLELFRRAMVGCGFSDYDYSYERKVGGRCEVCEETDEDEEKEVG